MTHYERLKKKRLGDLLVDEGLVGKDAMIAALHEQQVSGQLLSEVLLKGEHLSEYLLARTLVEQQQMPYIDLACYALHKDLIKEFAAGFLHKNSVVPLENFGGRIAFAVQEIPNPNVIERLKVHSPNGLFFFVALASDVKRCLQEFAPLEGKERLVVAKQTLGEDTGEDRAWQSLFDAANESVIAELSDEED